MVCILPLYGYLVLDYRRQTVFPAQNTMSDRIQRPQSILHTHHTPIRLKLNQMELTWSLTDSPAPCESLRSTRKVRHAIADYIQSGRRGLSRIGHKSIVITRACPAVTNPTQEI